MEGYVAAGYPVKIARFMAQNPPPAFELWACNAKSFTLFEAMGTQWRTGMNGPTGMDYGVLECAARLRGIRLTRKRLGDFQAMEFAALAAMAERRKQ